MKLFRKLHILKIILLVETQMALFLTKELTNLFYLLLIFVYLDINVMFIFLILLCATQCMIVDKKTL